jgi:hypothetical protein
MLPHFDTITQSLDDLPLDFRIINTVQTKLFSLRPGQEVETTTCQNSSLLLVLRHVVPSDALGIFSATAHVRECVR